MAYAHYQSIATEKWGTSEFKFSEPPEPTFEPEPGWGGLEFFRAHAFYDDTGFYNSIMSRMSSAVGVGFNEARYWHRRIYGGLVNLAQVLPADIGAAAAYEAYRYWKYHQSAIFRPIGGDIERQREALIALAIGESTQLWQYTGRALDTYGRQDAAESAAATAQRIARRVLVAEMGGNGMGAGMGGVGAGGVGAGGVGGEGMGYGGMGGMGGGVAPGMGAAGMGGGINGGMGVGMNGGMGGGMPGTVGGIGGTPGSGAASPYMGGGVGGIGGGGIGGAGAGIGGGSINPLDYANGGANPLNYAGAGAAGVGYGGQGGGNVLTRDYAARPRRPLRRVSSAGSTMSAAGMGVGGMGLMPISSAGTPIPGGASPIGAGGMGAMGGMGGMGGVAGSMGGASAPVTVVQPAAGAGVGGGYGGGGMPATAGAYTGGFAGGGGMGGVGAPTGPAAYGGALGGVVPGTSTGYAGGGYGGYGGNAGYGGYAGQPGMAAGGYAGQAQAVPPGSTVVIRERSKTRHHHRRPRARSVGPRY